jgi:subtilisin-like proprotein convertase family protein
MNTNMKTKQLLAVMAAAVLVAVSASAQPFTTNLTFNVNQAIPDADNNGLALVQNLTLPTLPGPITDVNVTLNISGGFNGDLYAYLAGPGTGFAVLLNRTGVGSGSNPVFSYGYSDTGFLNVTFDDAAANSIQYYQTPGFGATYSGGALQGTWQPEGVNIDPQSSPSSFFGAAQTDMLSSFNGNLASGTWTLFLADLSGGGQSTIVSYSYEITALPEPGTMTLAAIGGLAVLALRHSRQRKF